MSRGGTSGASGVDGGFELTKPPGLPMASPPTPLPPGSSEASDGISLEVFVSGVGVEAKSPVPVPSELLSGDASGEAWFPCADVGSRGTGFVALSSFGSIVHFLMFTIGKTTIDYT